MIARSDLWRVSWTAARWPVLRLQLKGVIVEEEGVGEERDGWEVRSFSIRGLSPFSMCFKHFSSLVNVTLLDSFIRHTLFSPRTSSLSTSNATEMVALPNLLTIPSQIADRSRCVTQAISPLLKL